MQEDLGAAYSFCFVGPHYSQNSLSVGTTIIQQSSKLPLSVRTLLLGTRNVHIVGQLILRQKEEATEQV